MGLDDDSPLPGPRPMVWALRAWANARYSAAGEWVGAFRRRGGHAFISANRCLERYRRVTKLSFPRMGQERYAIRIIGKEGGWGDMVFVRRGDVVMLVVVGAPFRRPNLNVETFVRRASDKLSRTGVW